MKIYLSKIKEDWIIDRIKKEWLKENKSVSTKFLTNSDIIWLVAPWLWNKTPIKHLRNKKVLCSIYHIDFNSFDKKQEKDFYQLEEYVDEFHVISNKTKNQLKQLTNKKITSIPLWINQSNYFYIQDKDLLRKKFGFNKNDYLIGSFQRDTEGSDLKSPKLIKGPDIFVNIAKKIHASNPNLKVILSGKRRHYVIEELNKYKIPFQYYEMADIATLNELYNILDLYIVSSRLEGGPQAIVECGISKTPIVSTDVGVASEILHPESIFDPNNFFNSKPNIEYAYEKSEKLAIPVGMKPYFEMFKKLYEN